MESFYRYIISVPYYKLIEIESIIQNICAENIKKCGIETRYYYTIKRTNIDDTQSYYVMENSGEFFLHVQKKVDGSLFITSVSPIKDQTDNINYNDEKLHFKKYESRMVSYYTMSENIIIACYIDQYLEMTICSIEVVFDKDKIEIAKNIIDSIFLNDKITGTL